MNEENVYVVLESDGDMGYILDKVFLTEHLAKKYIRNKPDTYNYHIEKTKVISQ